ncbi:MAG: RnfABCDGE type electron transport complex subunit A [Candidatus Margulisiibacteriota bacterium]
MIYALFLIFFSAMIANNILLVRFLGLCSFFGISNKIETSVSMGLAVLFVMDMATVVSWLIYYYLLLPFDLVFLRTIVFIIVIASLVQMVEMFLKKSFPFLYRALGVYLPLITTNCAILGASFLIIDFKYTLIESLVFSTAVALGYTLAIVMFAGMRQRLENAPIPESLKGYPIAFILAGLMSLSFLGFVGMFGLHM